MLRAKPYLEEVALYFLITAFFGMVAAGIVAHKHGEHCGHTPTYQAKTP